MCAVPQSLFGKRVSVKGHAVKIQRMSELDEQQKTFVFMIHEKKGWSCLTSLTRTQTHALKTHTMETTDTRLMHHDGTTDNTY